MNLNQVTIYSDKTVETVEFFEKLGLRRIVDSLPRYARLECPDGEATLSVSEFHEYTPINNIVLYSNVTTSTPRPKGSNPSASISMKTQPIARGSGGRPLSPIPTATAFASFTPVRIAKTRPGV